MATISVTGSFVPAVTDIPLDSRMRIAAEADAAAIDNPYIGLEFRASDTGIKYLVKTLKDKKIGSISVANGAVDQYVRIYEITGIDAGLKFADGTLQIDAASVALKTDLAGYAAAGHTHSEYALKSEIPAAADLSGYLTITAAAAAYAAKSHTHSEYALTSHDHDGVYAAKDHTHSQYLTADDLDAGSLSQESLDKRYALKEHDHSQYLTTSAASSAYLTIASASSTYAVKSHSHEGVYAPVSHEHSGYLTQSIAGELYAAKSHTHSEYAATGHTHSDYALTSHNHDTVYAAVGHTHANYENRLAALETASAAIFHLGIVRPNYDDALHLQIQKNGTAVVDTANAGDRAKVKIFTGQEWVEFPLGGAGSPFSEMSVDIDLTSLGGGTHYLRYKWYNSSASTDWVGVTFPSSGNSGGAGGGSGSPDFSVYIDPATNSWIINGEDSGVCAVGRLNVVTSIPDNPVEGMILIT